MTALQKVAMGLVVVMVDAYFAGYDAVVDPLGWLLVLAGLVALRRTGTTGSGLTWLAGLALLAAVISYPPQVYSRLDAAGGWALSLPQLAFCFALCTALADPATAYARRLLVLRWAFVAVAAVPMLVLGGGVEALRDPLAFVVVAANVYLVYLLFRVDRALVAGSSPAGEPG